MSDLDLSQPLRDAIMGEVAITAILDEWNGEPSVHTRRPLPADVKSTKCIAISPNVAMTDQDALNSERPVIVRDIIAYGKQPADYREVEQLGFFIRALFHRRKWSINPPEGYGVIDIQANGPFPAPTDDDGTVARLVSLTIRLGRRQ